MINKTEKGEKSNTFYSCILINTAKLISKKWIGFIFCQLFENEKMSFNELKNGISEKSNESITNSTLSQTLKDLEENNILTKEIEPYSHPPHSIYQLTDKGKELRIIFAMLKQWGGKWAEKEKTQTSCCVVQYLPELELKLDVLNDENFEV